MAGITRGVRRFVAVAVASMVVGGVLATPAAAGKKPLPLVTLKEAKKVVKGAVALDNEAGANNDVTIIEDFSTGLYADINVSLLELASAYGEPAWEEYEAEVVEVFTVRTTSYPRLFLAQVETDIGGGTIDRSTDVFIQDSKKADWLWERSIAHPDDGWPTFLVDKDGYVDPTVKANKVAHDPAEVAAELAAYLSISGPGALPDNAELFEASDGTDAYRSAVEEFAFAGNPEGWSASFAATPSDHDVLILPLKDGGALVNIGLSSTTRLFGESASPETAISQDAERTLFDARIPPGVYWEFFFDDLEAISILVPTKKSGDGITALPVLYGPTGARATSVTNPGEYE